MKGEIVMVYRVTCSRRECYVERELEQPCMTAAHRWLETHGWTREGWQTWVCPECAKQETEKAKT